MGFRYDADPSLRYLSYWTDAGAAYYYNTENGTASYEQTMIDAKGAPFIGRCRNIASHLNHSAVLNFENGKAEVPVCHVATSHPKGERPHSPTRRPQAARFA